MKKTILSLIGLLLVTFSFAQEDEVAQILAKRKASNLAIRNFDHELNATFSTEDAFITT